MGAATAKALSEGRASTVKEKPIGHRLKHHLAEVAKKMLV
jgi:hypothetical protein